MREIFAIWKRFNGVGCSLTDLKSEEALIKKLELDGIRNETYWYEDGF